MSNPSEPVLPKTQLSRIDLLLKARTVISSLVGCLENWMEIADKEDRREYDVEAIKAALAWEQQMESGGGIDFNKPHHYFVSSWLNWSTDSDLMKCLAKQKRRDRSSSGYKAGCCEIWLVPLPESAHYRIQDYAPQVDGAVKIAVQKWVK